MSGTSWRVADAIADALEKEGIGHIFGVPGESYLALLDALYDRRDRIRFVTARHESAAAQMAEAAGKASGRPGVCAVTRGPGATHAAIGVHTAQQDSTPMLLLVGQVPLAHKGREAFQEIDYTKMFGAIAKWVVEIEKPEETPAIMRKAFEMMQSGRMGPVVIALPEDVLDAVIPKTEYAPAAPRQAEAKAADVDAVTAALSRAERPMILAGGSGWGDDGLAALKRFAEANDIPVACAFRRQDRFPASSGCYAGDVGFGLNPALKARLLDADVLVAFGTRLGEVVSQGYTLPLLPADGCQALIHIHAEAAELGKVYKPALAIHANPSNFAAALRDKILPESEGRAEARAAARADYLAWSTPGENPGSVQIGEIWAHIRDMLPDDSFICNGAGNYAIWLHRYYRFNAPRTQLAPTCGAMGYGFPAAIAAKIMFPERVAVAAAGDGCFQMALAELATARQEGANVIVLVFNNAKLGTIRMHQEREFPGRTIGTAFASPDFAAIARAYGCHAERITETKQFAPAFAAALAARTPALLEIMVPESVLTPSLFMENEK